MYSSKTFNTKKLAVAEDEVKSWPPKVTFRNSKTGLVERQEPYIMRTVGSKDNRDRVNYVEFPAGSGNLWSKDWQPAGRWDKSQPEGKRYLKDAVHVAWAPPVTEDMKLASDMAKKDVRIAELERELSAIQAEKDVKIKSAAKKDPGV